MMSTRGFKQLQEYLIKLNKIKTLRQISEDEFDGRITYGTINRCIKGIEPKDDEIREILNLPQLVTQEWHRDKKGRRVKAPE